MNNDGTSTRLVNALFCRHVIMIYYFCKDCKNSNLALVTSITWNCVVCKLP